VRHEEHPAELGAVRVEGGQPRLAQPRGEHHQACGVPLLSRPLERREGPHLHRVGLGGRGRGLGGGLELHGGAAVHGGLAAGAVLGEPVGGEGLRLGGGEEGGEGLGYRAEAVRVRPAGQAAVPLDAAPERRGRQVRAPHVRHPAPVPRAAEVRFGVEARAPAGLEDLELHLGAVRLGEVQESLERVRVRHVQVVPREEPQGAPSPEEVREVPVHLLHPAALDEGHGDVHGPRRVQVRAEGGPERVCASLGEVGEGLGAWGGGLGRGGGGGGGRAREEVVALARDDVPHAAPWVRDVPLPARDDVHVEVMDGLPGRGPGVQADVEVLGVTVLAPDVLAGHQRSLGELRALGGRRVEPGGDVPLRHQERVPGRHRERVPEPERQRAHVEELVRPRVAEGAGRVGAHGEGTCEPGRRVTVRRPGRPAWVQGAQRQARTGRRARQCRWHTGQRCSYQGRIVGALGLGASVGPRSLRAGE
jgi:hypothetical protein